MWNKDWFIVLDLEYSSGAQETSAGFEPALCSLFAVLVGTSADIGIVKLKPLYKDTGIRYAGIIDWLVK